MGVKAPVYVAGFERGVLPIGRWSISITLSRNSRPLIVSQGAGVCLAPFKRIEAVLNKVSIVSVDLPPPDTPVTQISLPSGKSAVTDCRLFPVALTTVSILPFPLRLTAGTAISFIP